MELSKSVRRVYVKWMDAGTRPRQMSFFVDRSILHPHQFHCPVHIASFTVDPISARKKPLRSQPSLAYHHGKSLISLIVALLVPRFCCEMGFRRLWFWGLLRRIISALPGTYPGYLPYPGGICISGLAENQLNLSFLFFRFEYLAFFEYFIYCVQFDSSYIRGMVLLSSCDWWCIIQSARMNT
jgi:hypothetical protein